MAGPGTGSPGNGHLQCVIQDKALKRRALSFPLLTFKFSAVGLGYAQIYTDIDTHTKLLRYQQILTAKKTQGSLFALSGLLTLACVAISCPLCPETTRMGKEHQLFQSTYNDPYLII